MRVRKISLTLRWSVKELYQWFWIKYRYPCQSLWKCMRERERERVTAKYIEKRVRARMSPCSTLLSMEIGSETKSLKITWAFMSRWRCMDKLTNWVCRRWSTEQSYWLCRKLLLNQQRSDKGLHDIQRFCGVDKWVCVCENKSFYKGFP